MPLQVCRLGQDGTLGPPLLRDMQGYPLLIHKGPGEAETKHEDIQVAHFWDTLQEEDKQVWSQSPNMSRRKLALGAGSPGDGWEGLDATMVVGPNRDREPGGRNPGPGTAVVTRRGGAVSMRPPSSLSSHPQTLVPFRVQFKVPPPPKSLCFLTLFYCLILKSPAQNFITAHVMLRHSVVSDYCDPRDCSPQGSSVHEILQARILEWVPIPFSKGSS